MPCGTSLRLICVYDCELEHQGREQGRQHDVSICRWACNGCAGFSLELLVSLSQISLMQALLSKTVFGRIEAFNNFDLAWKPKPVPWYASPLLVTWPTSLARI